MDNPIREPWLLDELSIIPILSQSEADKETEIMQHAVKHYFEWTEKGKPGHENTFFFKIVPNREIASPSDYSTIGFQFDVKGQSFAEVSHVSYRNASPSEAHKKAALMLRDKLEGLLVYRNKKVELIESMGHWGIVLDGPDAQGEFTIAFLGNKKETIKAKRDDLMLLSQ